MAMPSVLISAAVMSLLRNEVTMRCIADRFGVTEIQVSEWRDIFTVGGILALAELNGGGSPRTPTEFRPAASDGPETAGSDPKTKRVLRGRDPTTPPHRMTPHPMKRRR